MNEARFNKRLLYWSLVVGFIAYNLWPFLWTDVFYQLTGVQKLFVSLLIVNLTRSDIWLNRGACIFLGLAILELIDEFKGALMIIKFFPTQYEIVEYIAAFLIVVCCLIGYRGLFKMILLFQLNFIQPCQRKTNSIGTEFRQQVGSRYLSGGLAA